MRCCGFWVGREGGWNVLLYEIGGWVGGWVGGTYAAVRAPAEAPTRVAFLRLKCCWR